MSPDHDREIERRLAELAERSLPSPQRLPALYRRVEATLDQRGSVPISRSRLALVAVAILLPCGLVAWLSWANHRAHRPLDIALESEQPASSIPLPPLALRYQGAGHVGGTVARPDIEWVLGRIELELEPDASAELTLRTVEATVRVTGTRFAVERDAAGTKVEVAEGRVAVRCQSSEPPDGERALAVGESILCVPTTSAGLLGRARLLQQQGDLLGSEQAVEQGLALATRQTPARGELLALAVQLRLLRGDEGSAREAARAYLDEGFPARADEIQRIMDELNTGRSPEGSER